MILSEMFLLLEVRVDRFAFYLKSQAIDEMDEEILGMFYDIAASLLLI